MNHCVLTVIIFFWHQNVAASTVLFAFADPPYVVTESTSLSNLEEEKDSVTMRCMAESNPPAKVWWEKEGVNGIFSPDKEITISPVTRTTAGTYKCVAQNALGMSEPAFVELDVKCKSHYYHHRPLKSSLLFTGKCNLPKNI